MMGARLGTARRRVRLLSASSGRYVRLARHLSLVQTVVAAAKATFAMALLSVWTPAAPLAIALMAFAVYNANNLADRDEDALNCPRRLRLVTRWSREIAVVAGLSAVAALGVALIAGGTLAGGLLLAPAVAGVIYSAPVLPGGRARRLKDVFLANTLLVATAWAVTVAFLPAVLSADVTPLAALVVCGYFFGRTVVSVEVFNGRDVPGDRASGVPTLPVVLGLSDTQLVLLLVDAVSMVFVLWAGPIVGLSTTALLAVFPVTMFSMLLTVALTEVRNWDGVCLAKDGEYMALGLLGLFVLL